MFRYTHGSSYTFAASYDVPFVKTEVWLQYYGRVLE